jgi:hypothetical protein
VQQLAILRLDGDMYESTIQCLRSLYHRVAPGGFVIIDDFGLPPCRLAVEEFRESPPDRGTGRRHRRDGGVLATNRRQVTRGFSWQTAGREPLAKSFTGGQEFRRNFFWCFSKGTQTAPDLLISCRFWRRLSFDFAALRSEAEQLAVL